MPKLSVVIPVYNVAPYLNECLDSLLSQTFTDFEAIIVNDGSTDGSVDILKSYSDKDSRIKFLSQSNKGVCSARNLALNNCNGEWIAFLDADDTIDRRWFEKMMRHTHNNVDIVHADAAYCFNAKRAARYCNYKTFLRDGWSVLNFVRRSVIGDLRYQEGMRFKEDVIFFTALAMKTNNIALVSESGYHYRRREGSAISLKITNEDSLRFYKELSRLGVPRDDFGKAIGYDLVLWVKGRDWSCGYRAQGCPVLAFWRKEIEAGILKYSDVRFWWRLGLWRWVKFGDLSWLKKTLDFRIILGFILRGLR